ncbi:hypothetical protein TNCT_90461 [Trichonephila clavata]|uniref:Uncharacterized protein n=1 Tax=Trichonephila clavata TaxID=2740835 RepID=A0A8X6FYN3_TRICU|nr:hypothetical protein TNCT_90461 [Trichonephila clavata]
MHDGVVPDGISHFRLKVVPTVCGRGTSFTVCKTFQTPVGGALSSAPTARELFDGELSNHCRAISSILGEHAWHDFSTSGLTVCMSGRSASPIIVN